MHSAFAGIIYPDVLQVTDLVENMLHVLQHRAEGAHYVHTYKNFQLGCIGLRYTISPKKNHFLCLDGWIDNESALRDVLSELEPSAIFANDLELLLLAYKHWGNNFLGRLSGEFALMLLDQDRNILLLARDFIGKKPLYWYQDKRYFLFGSELKSLLATGIVPQTPAPDAIASYLFFGFTPQDMTPIKDVNKLLPAHYLIFSLNQGQQIHPYWSYSSFFLNRTHAHKSQIVKHINELLEENVRVRIPREGPLGCFVSGGLGSATIAYYVQRIAQEHPIQAFTEGFRGYSEEDINATKTVCRNLSIKQTIGEMTPSQFLEEYPKIVWFLDEPLSDPNVMATWGLAKNSSRFTKTVYSGMGSDELLAGHSRYTIAEREVALVNRLSLLPAGLVKHLLVPLYRIFYPSAAFAILKGYRTNPWQFEYLRHAALFDEPLLEEASPKLAGLFNPETFLNKFHHLPRIQSNVSSFLYFDVKTRLPDAFILQYERLTRACGLTWHTPFLGKSLVEYAASLPEPESLLESETASYLKPLVQDIFPESFTKRPKKTRKHLLSSWVEHQGVFDVFQLLLHGTLVETGLISQKWLSQQLVTSDQMRNAFPQLFALLNLEIWFKLFINRSITAFPPSISLKDLLQEY